ncbi:hypothetical protein FHS18_005519 [Paenibacillus phyllosphaerae]|uniref:Uncharacterized protein n=1 Tax=Paenibacillus phyllosphaerae TaxID=274593 RepID=A0A7W5B2T9_9BACL|nr:hypothetical protein [Paenibacillus phyllosphaerae]
MLFKFAIRVLENPMLNGLIAGLQSAAISYLLLLVFTKGLVLMSIIVILLSLVACGELV